MWWALAFLLICLPWFISISCVPRGWQFGTNQPLWGTQTKCTRTTYKARTSANKVRRQRLFIHYTIECGVSDLGHSSLLWKITNKPEPATPLWPIPPPSDTPEAISRLSLAPQTLTHWVERSPMVTGIYNLACKHCSTLPQHCPDTEGERDPATTPGQEQGYWAWLHADSELYHRDSSCVSI